MKHDVRNGTCVTCHRTGSDLKPPCPGYKTAGEYVTKWKKSEAPKRTSHKKGTK